MQVGIVHSNMYGKLLKTWIYLAFFNSDGQLEQNEVVEMQPAAGFLSCFLTRAGWFRRMCVAGRQMRADRFGSRHVGLRGKSFSTKTLKEEREINTCKQHVREQDRNRKREKERFNKEMKMVS